MRFNEIDTMSAEQLDFVPREQRTQLYSLVFAFACTIAVIFVSAYTPLFHHMEVYTPLIAILLVAFLCLYAVSRHQINLDQVMSAEYQLLLFSQAATLGTSFCLFVRRDGTIVFADDGLQKVFPQFNYGGAQALDGLFAQSRIGQNDRERLTAAIVNHTHDHLIFPVPLPTGEKKEYVLTVDPLPRPSGFSVIRGREFHGKRSGVQLMPDVLRSTSVDKLDHMLATTPIAHYSTDPYGRFEYINPAFSTLLGYKPGEILELKLSLHHVISSLNDKTYTEETSLSEFTGEASLLLKNSTHVKSLLVQHVIRDQAGKLLGATGTLMPPPQR